MIFQTICEFFEKNFSMSDPYIVIGEFKTNSDISISKNEFFIRDSQVEMDLVRFVTKKENLPP